MNLMDLRVITVDSFTHCRFGGNPAAVVPECEEVPESYFQQIANEINLAQTAFVHQKSEDRYLIEFFTPKSDILFSGHATIAAFFVLADMGYIRPDQESDIKHVECELTGGSVLPLRIKYSEDYEVERISIEMPMLERGLDKNEDRFNKNSIANILKVDEGHILKIDSGGYFSKDLFVFLDSKKLLDELEIDFWSLTDINEDTDTNGLYVLWADDSKEKLYAYGRYFSPKYGIYEEAATGSAAAAVGEILLDDFKRDKVTIYQGQIMKRPSVIDIEREDDRIILSGISRVVMDAVMYL